MMFGRIRREAWKWLHVVAALSITVACLGTQFTHGCLDGWWLVYIGGIAFAEGFYILTHY